MRSLTDIPTPSLGWRSSGTPPPDFELQGSAGLFATLSLLDEACALARVKTAEGSWTLKHLGLLNPVVTLREEGAKTNLAVFHPHALRHGKLLFEDGAVFGWAWQPDGSGAVLDPDGHCLVRLLARPSWGRTADLEGAACDVHLDLESFSRRRYALLAAFGWDLILFDHLRHREDPALELSLRL
jgi:hypothetical protein